MSQAEKIANNPFIPLTPRSGGITVGSYCANNVHAKDEKTGETYYTKYGHKNAEAVVSAFTSEATDRLAFLSETFSQGFEEGLSEAACKGVASILNDIREGMVESYDYFQGSNDYPLRRN